MEDYGSQSGSSRFNDYIIKNIINFKFFEKEKLDSLKQESAFYIMQHHLKDIHGFICNKISNEFSNKLFIKEDIFAIKKLSNILSSIKTISIKEHESKAHDQEIIRNKIIRLNKKIKNFDVNFPENNEELKEKLTQILNSITKNELDYIYDILGKKKIHFS